MEINIDNAKSVYQEQGVVLSILSRILNSLNTAEFNNKSNEYMNFYDALLDFECELAVRLERSKKTTKVMKHE